MAGSTRIKGNKLMLKLGSGADEKDYWADLTAYELYNEEADADVTTFADASEGGARQHKLKITSIQSLDVASFWRMVWENTGQDVPFTLAPFGNVVPSDTQPHFAGTVTIGPKPTLGGEAGNSAFTTEVDWNVLNEPTLVTTAP